MGRDKHILPAQIDNEDPLNAVIGSLTNDYDRGFNTYSAGDGIPHRAAGVRYYKNDDPEHLQPKSAGRVRCETFDIGDPEDKKRYEGAVSLVYSMARQGKAVINSVDRQFMPDKGSWMVYFEWIELFTYDPAGARGRSRVEPGILRRR